MSGVSEWFGKVGADLTAAFDALGRDLKRTESTRKKAAERTGIASEANVGLTALPAYVAELGSRLKVVDCSGNAIKKLPDTGLERLQQCHKLALGRNALGPGLPPALCELAALRTLVLSHNKLVELPEALGRLASLQVLDVAANRLERLPPSVGELRRLERLDAAGNRLAVSAERDVAGLAALGQCGALTELRLSRNTVAALPEALAALGKLKVLELDDNPLVAFPAAVLEGCGQLHTLSLHRTGVKPGDLYATPGFDAFEKRRTAKHSKQIFHEVIMNKAGLDDGLDHR